MHALIGPLIAVQCVVVHCNVFKNLTKSWSRKICWLGFVLSLWNDRQLSSSVAETSVKFQSDTAILIQNVDAASKRSRHITGMVVGKGLGCHVQQYHLGAGRPQVCQVTENKHQRFSCAADRPHCHGFLKAKVPSKFTVVKLNPLRPSDAYMRQ